MSNPMGNSLMQQEGGEFIANPVRIFLRLLGALMLVAGTAMVVLIAYPGPAEVAETMGKNCVHNDPGPTRTAESCNVMDVIDLTPSAPILMLVGLVLVLALKRSNVSST